MAEYISRETMINLLQSMADNAEANGFSYDREVIEAVRVTLAGIPAADVAQVVHGRWIYNPNGMDWNLGAWQCSVCKCNNNNLPGNDEYNPYIFQGSNYCPNCGAKMDEEVNGICADDKQSLKTCRTCKNYTPNHGYRGGEMGTCCFWKSITGNCMAVHQSRIGCEHYDKKI